MKKVSIESVIYEAAPDYKALIITCDFINSENNDKLWKEIHSEIAIFRKTHVITDINKRSAIFEMRKLYKKLGKDPNRYRPSAEALCRRILHDKDLYKINTMVDIINLISIKTGFSIGGFDCEKINGNLNLGVGVAGEKYEGIGRGLLNIEGLPVYRDNTGGIGTPTSDEERTKIDVTTKKLLMIINSAAGSKGLDVSSHLATHLLTHFVQAKDIEFFQI